jgi:dipeptidyl aminopeptidase/acylaminoacyl peptidase
MNMKTQAKIFVSIVVVALTVIIYSDFDLPSNATLAQSFPDSLRTLEKVFVDSVSLPQFMNRQFNGHDLRLGKVLADNAAYTRYYITYTSGTLKISGIMNVPKGNGPFPVLILNHGFIPTTVYTNGRGLKREQDYLARKGYVVIHPDYRNHADSDKDTLNGMRFRLGYAEDVINAVKAVQNSDLKYFDKKNIGMLGHSMGGGLCLTIMVTYPELVKAFVLFAPVSADVRDNFYRWDIKRTDLAEKIVRTYGRPEENPKFWDNISPMTFLSNIKTPILLHHGTRDESCPLGWSERLADSLKAHGKNIAFYEYPYEKHEFIDRWPLVMERTTEFFDKYLK